MTDRTQKALGSVTLNAHVPADLFNLSLETLSGFPTTAVLRVYAGEYKYHSPIAYIYITHTTMQEVTQYVVDFAQKLVETYGLPTTDPVSEESTTETLVLQETE